ncbi:tpr domain containing protein [Grosmannia clavigera kw1407]|uniref:Tpr domain containing protein n=1 Tax=Grosmannia clavigera (strain kw1407 / UAMH 11150) TaxID=655863 RepID=F0XV90_GROCL|nr:tpr domain containing protein [Grosmannia clavigera kw1407]EFW98456.1 tpr domain containing protein [Grosmannia clavigera kw1407]
MPGNSVIRSTFIGEAYPPYTLPLASLTPIRLRDLTLETQHRGRVLIVRAFGKPNVYTSIINAVEDEFGDVDRLAIYNLLSTVAPDDVLPQGAIAAIKEPYYKRTADGDLFVRVDHPSDFVLLKLESQLVPPELAPRVTELDLSALKLKERGNAEFKRGNWQKADELYSNALAAADLVAADDDDLVRALHRNRAATRLRLGRYELTIVDALASIVVARAETSSEAVKDFNIKALYRAGRATYKMGSFFKAKNHFKAALKIDTQRKEVKVDLCLTKRRLAEQENGDYDFSAIAAVVNKLLWNPTLANRYLNLHDSSTFGNSKKITIVDSKVALDTFRVESIAELNRFGCPRVKSGDNEGTTEGEETSTGIWLQASYANHLCILNVSRAFIGDIIVVRALQNV